MAYLLLFIQTWVHREFDGCIFVTVFRRKLERIYSFPSQGRRM